MLTPKDWHFAQTILDTAYVDMAYLVAMPGVLAATLTVNDDSATEGNTAQHVAIVRSNDNGISWGAPIDIEPASAPEASWVMPWYDAERDLLYAFYTFNFEDVRSIPNSNGVGSTSRVDSIGTIAYRVSTDRGLTWGARQLIAIGAKDIDNRNPFAGAKQLLWTFGHPVVDAGKLYLGFSKCGVVVSGNQFTDTEAFLLRANIGSTLTGWAQLPNGGTGIKLPTPFWGGPAMTLTEEPSLVIHEGGALNVITRCDRGRLGESWSVDGGASFSHDWARSLDGFLTIYHPRGPGAMFRLPDGRFLLWTYNNGSAGFTGRSVVWYRIGYRAGNRIRWGRPAALCYSSDMAKVIGYPSFQVLGDELLVSASDKTCARLMRFPLAEL